mgnify:CR=1 FL=1
MSGRDGGMASSRRGFGRLFTFAIVATALAWLAFAAYAQTFRFSKFDVQGNQRIDSATIVATLGVTPGQSISAGALNDGFQRLQATGLFQNVDHVPVHVMGVQTIDPNRHGLGIPVDLVQGLDDVLARLLFLIRSDGILKVEKDDINVGFCSLFKHFRLASRNGQFGAVQACGGLINGVE